MFAVTINVICMWFNMLVFYSMHMVYMLVITVMHLVLMHDVLNGKVLNMALLQNGF